MKKIECYNIVYKDMSIRLALFCVEERLMKDKKVKILIVSGIGVLILVICGILLLTQHKVGDTIKTNDIELTLIRANMTNKLYKGMTDNLFLPFDDSMPDLDYREAKKGYAYIAFSVKVKNISSKKINLQNIFNSDNLIVKYKGHKYYSSTSEERCEKYCYKSGYMALKDENDTWQINNFNYLDVQLDPKQEIEDLRVYLNVPVSIKNKKNKFKIIFGLIQNDTKVKKYTYKVK